MLLTNLFRDQLDRYGEIDITMNILEEMIQFSSGSCQVIVNADDALSALSCYGQQKYLYHLWNQQACVNRSVSQMKFGEGRFCKQCGDQSWNTVFYHYSQLGDYKCPSCGFERPQIKYDAQEVKVGEQLSFQVDKHHLTANYKGFYNVYNILAAYAGLRTAGFSGDHFQDMLKKFQS